MNSGNKKTRGDISADGWLTNSNFATENRSKSKRDGSSRNHHSLKGGLHMLISESVTTSYSAIWDHEIKSIELDILPIE